MEKIAKFSKEGEQRAFVAKGNGRNVFLQLDVQEELILCTS